MNPDPVVLVLDFPIREGAIVEGEHEGFIDVLRETLANHPERENYITKYGPWLRDHPLLCVQQPSQPARWIHINLIVQDEDGEEQKRITIAVRDDNVYLMGFKNQHDNWYEFGFEGRSGHFIAGSTFLGCDVSYTSLVGGLVSLSLRKYDVIRAVRELSRYQHTGPANNEAVRHLARLCIIICECARMIPHRDTVTVRWNFNDQAGITPQQAENIKNWSKMSRELLSDPYPEVNRYLDVVHLLLNTRARGSRSGQQDQQGQTRGGGGSSQQGPGSSKFFMPSSRRTSSSGGSGAQDQKGQPGGNSVRTRPLVEVFYVESDLRDTIGTITVFDGKRGQIIYKHGQQSSSTFKGLNYGLALTGPYKAISADGSFAIQFYGIPSGTDTSDDSSKVIGEMFWDCDAHDYNKGIIRDVISTDTGSRLAEVRYVVWSDAVEATVEVNLLLPGITHIYGCILAVKETIFRSGHEAALFDRGEDGKVELVPSSADSTVPLELRRSVIAVPMSKVMSIRVELRAATPSNKSDVILKGFIDFSADKQTGEIRIDPRGVVGTEQSSEQRVKVQVNITSPGFHTVNY